MYFIYPTGGSSGDNILHLHKMNHIPSNNKRAFADLKKVQLNPVSSPQWTPYSPSYSVAVSSPPLVASSCIPSNQQPSM